MKGSEEYVALFLLGAYLGLLLWALYGDPPGPSENPTTYLMFLLVIGYALWGIITELREKLEVV